MPQTDVGLIGPDEVSLEALPVGVMVLDERGIVVLVNRELERQFGYEREEFDGLAADEFLPGVRELVSAGDDGANAAVSPRQLSGRRKAGERFPVDVSVRRLSGAGGASTILSIVDVSTRRAAEESRRVTLEAQLALERFLADLSGQFINLPTERIDAAIHDGLRQSCQLLALDRASFARIDAGGMTTPLVSWHAPDVPALEPLAFVPERHPWTFERILAGETVRLTSLDDVPNEIDRRSFQAVSTRSAIAMPLLVDGHVAAAVVFGAVRAERQWAPNIVQRLEMIASVFAQVVARHRREEALQAALAEVQQLKNQLQVENVYLRQEARERHGPPEIVGQSAALRQVLAQIEQVASTDSTVLLLGETGTGKELFATHLHSLGSRRARPMVRVNCAAIPATLIESELFGREKGAFTGALARQVGRFELADHSAIFLDEIGDLPLEVQVKLLRVLEERKFERLGSPRSIPVDTRIIAATHRNLEQRIGEGAFREDLYYRLNVFPIHVPALRDRPEDIPLLVWRFVEEFAMTFGKRVDTIDRETMVALQRYPWPGNIRELRNVVERAMIVVTGRRLTIPLPHATPAAAKRGPKLIDVEKEHIRAVLESAAWRIRGAGGAADRLGMKPTTLETRMAKLGLKRPGQA